MLKNCKLLLAKLMERLPQFEMDGMRNIWIIKPGAKSRGRGECNVHNMDIIVTRYLEHYNTMVKTIL